MSEAPETIWTTGNSQTGSWNNERLNEKLSPPQTEYRRTDLPLTTAQIMADTRVKALVEALGAMVARHTLYCGGPDLPHAGHTDVKIMGMANAALSALEPKP